MSFSEEALGLLTPGEAVSATLELEVRPREELVREYRPFLLGLARKLCGGKGVDPEDLVQETFERAFREYERLSRTPEAPLRGWLCATLVHRFLDLCRKRKREMTALPELQAIQPESTRSPEDRYERLWKSFSEERFRAAVQKLKPKHREVYELHATGLRYREIAQRLGVPLGSVGFWLSQAREALREMLEADTGGGQR